MATLIFAAVVTVMLAWMFTRSVVGPLGQAVSVAERIANGDLTCPEELAPMLAASRADAVMVGRGSQGRPWLPGLLAGAIGEAP